MAQRTRNAVLLAKTEVTPGTDPTPAHGSDAVLVESPRWTPTANLVQTNEVTGSLDQLGSIVGGMRVTVEFDVLMRGSGSAGTAPEWGVLMKACGWAETVTATAVPSAAEALGAGSSQTEATLGSSASSTANAYRGMPIVFSEDVTGTSFIAAYSTGKVATLTDDMGATLDADVDYQIPANVVYGPASTSIPSLTMYLFQDGLRARFVGCRGTVSLRAETGGIGRFTFRFEGLFVDLTDVAVPAATYDDVAIRPPVIRNGAFKIERVARAIAALTLDAGNTLTMPANPNATEGFDPTEITARNLTGSVDPMSVLVATQDTMAAFRAGTKQILHERWGSTAGNRLAVTIPAGLYTGRNQGDREGLATEELPFEATGRDAGAFICVW